MVAYTEAGHVTSYKFQVASVVVVCAVKCYGDDDEWIKGPLNNELLTYIQYPWEGFFRILGKTGEKTYPANNTQYALKHIMIFYTTHKRQLYIDASFEPELVWEGDFQFSPYNKRQKFPKIILFISCITCRPFSNHQTKHSLCT